MRPSRMPCFAPTRRRGVIRPGRSFGGSPAGSAPADIAPTSRARRGGRGAIRVTSTLLDSITAQGDPFGSMHPNASGHAEIADALYSAVWFLVAPQAPEPAPRDPVICFDT